MELWILYRVTYIHEVPLGHGFPSDARIESGPIRSKNADSSSDFVRRRPTIPVLLTPILYPSPM